MIARTAKGDVSTRQIPHLWKRRCWPAHNSRQNPEKTARDTLQNRLEG